MKKLFLFVFLAFAVTVSVQAQTKTGSNNKVPGRTSFFAEFGGPGILFSANIDSRFKPERLGFGGRFGLGFVTADYGSTDNNGNYNWDSKSVVTIPAQVNYIFGKESSPHAFEVGAGLTYIGKKLDIMNFYDDKKSQLFGTASFMYRRQPIDGGFSWRIGFTPIIAKGYIQSSAAASLGYNF